MWLLLIEAEDAGNEPGPSPLPATKSRNSISCVKSGFFRALKTEPRGLRYLASSSGAYFACAMGFESAWV